MGRFLLRWQATLFAAAFFPSFLLSQEQLCMRLERYAGIYSASLNPANTAFNR